MVVREIPLSTTILFPFNLIIIIMREGRRREEMGLTLFYQEDGWDRLKK